ncbi:hypothetical protein [Kitasatospora sp. NPDC008115]|uniref:hypothetical protein n=1 Tax=Kitasatospora sp. NPDC008115 TaxID=3364022 RepID=UPI0036EE7304
MPPGTAQGLGHQDHLAEVGDPGVAVLARCAEPAEPANAELPAPLNPDEQRQLMALPGRLRQVEA